MDRERKGWFFQCQTPDLPLSTLVDGLRQADHLPTGAAWWFGWTELTIALPGLLPNDITALPTDWDLLHLFSESVELRQIRRGGHMQTLLLSEQENVGREGHWQPMARQHRALSTRRILWGNRLRMHGGEMRGVLQFPRKLDYQVAGEEGHAPDYEEALVAEAWAYYDEEFRLQTVRYASISREAPGAKE